MNEKYNIPMETPKLSDIPYFYVDEKQEDWSIKKINVTNTFIIDYPNNFAFYYQVLKEYPEEYKKFVDHLIDDFSWIISHKNHAFYGKACMSPAFDLNKITNIN